MEPHQPDNPPEARQQAGSPLEDRHSAQRSQGPVDITVNVSVRRSGSPEQLSSSRVRESGRSEQPIGSTGSSESGRLERSQAPPGWCWSCHCWRFQCWKAGDWWCLECGNHNYANRSSCAGSKCGVHRPPDEMLQGAYAASTDRGQQRPELPNRPRSNWRFTCRTWLQNCFKPFDWMCPRCDHHNYATKQAWIKVCLP